MPRAAIPQTAFLPYESPLALRIRRREHNDPAALLSRRGARGARPDAYREEDPMGQTAGSQGRSARCIALVGPYLSGKTTLLEAIRSEERRVGKECRARWTRQPSKKRGQN